MAEPFTVHRVTEHIHGPDAVFATHAEAEEWAREHRRELGVSCVMHAGVILSTWPQGSDIARWATSYNCEAKVQTTGDGV
jgi:hypothetical protein